MNFIMQVITNPPYLVGCINSCHNQGHLETWYARPSYIYRPCCWSIPGKTVTTALVIMYYMARDLHT